MALRWSGLRRDLFMASVAAVSTATLLALVIDRPIRSENHRLREELRARDEWAERAGQEARLEVEKLAIEPISGGWQPNPSLRDFEKLFADQESERCQQLQERIERLEKQLEDRKRS